MASHRLRIRDLTVSYHRVPAVHHVTLELQCGKCIALLGPNGAGKTSFFKALVGLIRPEAGSIELGGHGAHRHDIAYLPQREAIDWDFPVTVRGLAEMGRYTRLGWWRRFGAADDAAVEKALARMELTELAGRQISALSGGQQQRAFLARALAQEAHVMLLDEPFTGLDKPAQDLLSQTLRNLAAAGNLVIASHHDLKTVPELFDEVIFLNGELIAAGDTATTFTEANIDKTFGTLAFAGEGHRRHHHHHPAK
ncbi:MAG TPA: metal ABC transporter ATP-binding protein [Chthoniobacterales bacterium]|jgi:manganese/iron transport system ATP-binding protein/manganese/zinc/iron transport system ATP- binding protein